MSIAPKINLVTGGNRYNAVCVHSYTKLEGALMQKKEITNMDKYSSYRCMKTVVFTEKQKHLET